jgi:hypothetical protein
MQLAAHVSRCCGEQRAGPHARVGGLRLEPGWQAWLMQKKERGTHWQARTGQQRACPHAASSR